MNLTKISIVLGQTFYFCFSISMYNFITIWTFKDDFKFFFTHFKSSGILIHMILDVKLFCINWNSQLEYSQIGFPYWYTKAKLIITTYSHNMHCIYSYIMHYIFVCILLIDCVFGTAWVVLSHNSWCYCAPGQIIFNPSEQECMMNRLANLLIFTDTHIVSHRSS